MKKININTIRHILSIMLTLFFSLISMATLLPEWWTDGEYSELPCDQFNSTPLTVKCTITARNRVTGAPIPNATVNLYLLQTSYHYLGGTTCTSPPQTDYAGSTVITNESGFVQHDFNNVYFRTSIDRNTITCSVHANNYSTAEVAVNLSRAETSVKIDVQLIDLSTQP